MSPVDRSAASDFDAFAAQFLALLREDALILLDASGVVRAWNAGAETLFGYRPEEVGGKDLSLLYPAEAIARGEPERDLRAARDAGRQEVEAELTRANGERFPAAVSFAALRDEAGTLGGFGLVVRDRTPRQQAAEEREALLRGERRGRSTAESASNHLHAIQRVTEVGLALLPFDQLLAALLDRVQELLAADTVVVLLRDGEELLAVAAIGLEEEVEQGVRVPFGAGFAGRVAAERRHIIVDDVSQYPVVNPILRSRGVHSLLGVPLIVEGDIRGVLHVGSLTPRRFTEEDAQLLQVVADRVALALAHARLAEAEQEARTAAATAAATARLREQFLGITAHELKTPLTVVTGYARMLERAIARGTLDEAVLKTAIEEIATQASRLDRLINDLLETSRVHEGRLTLNPEPMDLSELARDVARRFTEGPEASLLHRLVVDAPEPVRGEWDLGRLDQVVTNLVSNAIKYSPRGGAVTIRVRPRTGGGASLSVRDRGIGIPPHSQRELFQPFSRLVGRGGRGGIGLGLFLASQFVRRHGGTITVRSDVDRGSTFTVELPANVPVEEEADPPANEERRSIPPGH